MSRFFNVPQAKSIYEVIKYYIDDLVFKGNISSSTNLSTLENGIYGVDGSNSAFPTNDSYYGWLIQYSKTDGSYKEQVLAAGISGTSGLYHRRWIANNNAWSTWKTADVNSTNSTSKLFLMGATSQTNLPATYSNSNVYETNGVLNATSYSVNAAANIVYNSTTKSIDFTFN